MANREETATNLHTALETIRERMQAAGDETHAGRIGSLIGKLGEKRAAVAFCGHFSAGKSTLVNRLCGAELLPSSPIPTSANVVTIRCGEPRAVIRINRDGKGEEVTVPIDQLEAHCRDGEGVEAIDLYYPSPLLEGGLALLDTPGIDSTDDAHKLATESALHLADVVCYVMDYNHVQSEINFTFAKQLADWGKPLVLIVSQVDKHRESELSFADYQAGVETAFADWHLKPAAVLFISNRQPDHPHDQFEALTGLLAGIAGMKERLAAYSVICSARFLIAGHGRWLESCSEDERERLVEAAGGAEALDAVRAELAELRRQLEARRGEPEALRTALRREVQSLLDNAHIMPAAVRDLAGAMLESRKPGFRAGLLFAGAKTAAEREKRMRSFLEALNAQTKAAVERHLKALLRQAAERLDMRGESVERDLVDPIAFEMTEEEALRLIRPGAVFGNEYTMTYSRDASEAVKAAFRERAYAVIDRLAAAAAERAEEDAAAARERLAALADQERAVAALEALEAERAGRLAELDALLPAVPEQPELPRIAAERTGCDTRLQEEPSRAGAAGSAAAAAIPSTTAGEPAAAGGPGAASAAAFAGGPRPEGRSAAEDALGPQRRAAARLREAAALLAPYAPLAQTAQAMQAKAERLGSGRFTIALFGAFSAGKSSLANALIGRAALPVSPNPTTAAINRITAPDADYPDGFARIVMKSRDAMAADVRHSLTRLGLGEEAADTDDLEALLERADRLTPDRLHPGGRPHYAFLKAARQGWAACGPLLGEELRVDPETYRSYVADETRSCYVQEIDLHIDSPLADQGIVLVDTPGADSVNARHTDVAFHYIRNADAILFVTYYNHAFSQADRQFLLQLGRVKDQFELDKMFFIVNAADLAAGEDELREVLAHVEANLLQHGIRHPRLFPVSSLKALEAKRRGDAEAAERSGMPAFERAFAAFAGGELGGLAAAAADRELERAAGAVARWLEASRQDAGARQSGLERLRKRAAEAAAAVRAAAAQAAYEPLREELGELLHHVQRRVAFRFGELFGMAFNPSALQDDGRDLRLAVAACWEELRHALRVELTHELQATSLRMDNALRRLADKLYEAEAMRLKAELEGFDPAAFEYEGPNAEPPRSEWTTQAVDGKRLWPLFRSPRKFFEQGGREAMRAELERLLEPDIRHWMEELARSWDDAYAAAWRAAAEAAAGRLAEEIDAFIRSTEAAFAGAVQPDELAELLHRLEMLRTKMADENASAQPITIST